MQFYGDTVKQMALKQFIPGSPLRTLCLLMAGQPADVFCNATTYSSLPGSFNISRQPAEVIYEFNNLCLKIVCFMQYLFLVLRLYSFSVANCDFLGISLFCPEHVAVRESYYKFYS